jgi:undecaprenyl diphosphate synthase
MTEIVEKIKSLGILPRHVAIIMDGNGRFANSHGRPRIWGHQQGVLRVREIIETSAASGIEALTLYAFSEENWKRPSFEVKTIMKLVEKYLTSELKTMLENNIRFQMSGSRDKLPLSTLKVIEKAEAKTQSSTGMVLNICLSYGARSEILSAVKNIAAKVQEGSLSVDQIDEQCFSKELYTGNLVDPDLLIRTSGEQRISNFLLWQIAYSELFFSDLMWPEFNSEQYFNALESFANRDRRFGKVKYKATDFDSNEFDLAHAESASEESRV